MFLIRQVAWVDDVVSYEAGSWSGKSFRTSSKNKPHIAGQVYAIRRVAGRVKPIRQVAN